MAEDETVAARALRMRMKGSSWHAIEDAAGLPAAVLAELVADLLLATPEVPRDIELRLDLARLDSLLVAVWRTASRGDPKSVDQSMKILARRGELLSELGVEPPAAGDVGGAGEPSGSPEDRPAVTVSPAEHLARVRRAAAGSAAPALHLVEDDDGDED